MSDLPGTARPSSAAPWDLLVVGCGAGGLAAAVGFAENAPGGRVLVLERSSRYLRGWSTARTRSPFRPAEGFGCRPHEPGEGSSDAAHLAVLRAHAEPTVRWLADRHGVAFETCGANLVDGLATSLDLLGGSIAHGVRATGLSTDGLGSVTGVYVQQDGRTRHIAARHTVLASGGFQGSPHLLERHFGPTGGELRPSTPGGRNNRGDGIEMAVAVGAARGGRYDHFHGEPVDPRSHPAEALVLAYPYGILVDADGRRFLDEGADTPDRTSGDVAFRIWRDARQSAYLICDAKILRIDGHERLLARDQDPVTAPTVAELARRLDLVPDELTRTVDRFNAACRPTGPYDATRPDGRHTVDLVPPKSNWALALDTGPFLAWPVHCAIAFTFGGLRTDARSRVLTEQNEPIAGLYAVGETAGLHCGRCAGATSALRALTFGRLAGAEIARTRNAADPVPPAPPSP
ncbi:tricarballylate dehydrogenase [Streptomyces spiroverticillatus]|uniref:Tricarballylate dehydrogenase n=1 Tax=Streptomyces finlayi TaxID=67296 RepID=A0A919C860_9ACTN|nr:FAD-binding protein [Streptomyces finlayi]GGZ89953.1 tricarballylate dehydrogenase [Streptomyces spiroverticillatus]GHC80736.1 tricarballylate dehydrogenase [Streptomyces finlayi]